jgi:hypothetical protein
VSLTAPTAIAQTSVTLAGSVTPNGADTAFSFDYGLTTAYGSRTPPISAGAGTTPVPVQVAVGNLAPNTTYHYRLVATNSVKTTASADGSVRTAPADVRVAAAGDIACQTTGRCLSGARATADLIATLAPDMVLALGDTQYDAGAPESYPAYDSTWGRFKAITHPVAGNHEYFTPGATGYYGYFGAAAGNPTQGYYSFDAGPWHIVALNSECAIVSCNAMSPQAAWLRADLSAHPAVCTLAMWHRPRFASDPGTVSTAVHPLFQILYNARADVVLNGHEHNYERFAPQNPAGGRDDAHGIREFVVGTGGIGINAFGFMAPPNNEVRDATGFGVLTMTLHPASYDWSFTPVAGASFTDSGFATCH